ncbi:hypothetical protein CDL60_24825 [Roseateles noduli]|nr:hypothetical protein CDL60_24825 [Roseateles noduli]
MERVVSSDRLKQDFAARGLIDHLVQNSGKLGIQSSILYYDFPVFRDYEEALYRPSLLLLDKEKGIVLIRICNTELEVAHEDELLGELHSLLNAKLLNSKRLRKSRTTLKVDIHSLLYLPPGASADEMDTENQVISSYESLNATLDDISSSSCDDQDLAEIRSVIEGLKALSKSGNREISERDLKPSALIIRKLEDEIANFDAHQRRAALTVAVGPQRIRGLAGSGKTVVLAWKAAHLHLINPEAKVLFTFYTKSLYETVRRQITRFYRHFKDSDPNWENLHILHAWGGRREAGVYYNAAIENSVAPKSWGEVQRMANPFRMICKALNDTTKVKPKYDVVLVDEAQDMPETFFELLFHLTRGQRDEKSIIWAYDELQSIFEPRMRTPVELFGHDEDGQPRIDLDRSAQRAGLRDYFSNDLVLYKCYRNPLDVLVTSHAIGLGIYGPNIVQMLQNRAHWEDVGYEVKEGDFIAGSNTVIERPQSNSPLAIRQYQQKADLIQLYRAESLTDEASWIVKKIIAALDDGVKPDEILVICLDDRNAKNYFSEITTQLAGLGVASHDLLANPIASSNFSVEGRVTLSSVHKAKGNEASLVFAAGVDAIAHERTSRRGRNKLFTAFTRTKCWLCVSGFEGLGAPLFDELDRAIENSPELRFAWPDLAQVDMLQRDISRREDIAKRYQKDYLKRMAELGYSEEDALAELEVPEKPL